MGNRRFLISMFPNAFFLLKIFLTFPDDFLRKLPPKLVCYDFLGIFLFSFSYVSCFFPTFLKKLSPILFLFQFFQVVIKKTSWTNTNGCIRISEKLCLLPTFGAVEKNSSSQRHKIAWKTFPDHLRTFRKWSGKVNFVVVLILSLSLTLYTFRNKDYSPICIMLARTLPLQMVMTTLYSHIASYILKHLQDLRYSNNIKFTLIF